VPPLDFISLLEETGLIVPVGEWVIREACRLNHSWQAKGLLAVPVAVNVAAQQFNSDGFVDSLERAIRESGMAPHYLEVEVTESCLMEDVQANISVLEAIRHKNISIAVDDFGTGYSSLSYLQRFPINTLKIDRSFISNVHNRKDNDNAAIVTAIMALSHSLRLNVVAEGVEDAQELAYLYALGCKTIQGFLFSRPLDALEFEKLLADSISLQQTMQSIRDTLAVRRA
jgi:EAL domain-containing protein (putative c-di-GMP-specific phosphodiesterase class I)